MAVAAFSFLISVMPRGIIKLDVNPTLLFAVAVGMILVCAAGAAASRSVRTLR